MLVIFKGHVKPGHSPEQYADAWVRASKIIQSAPGARGTRLHRQIGDDNTLLAIASWETRAQRDAMESDQPAEVRRIIAEQAEFVDIEVIGEFEDPAWQVLPGEL
jgi:heme-degrading monooxygenase HmoA